MANKVTGDQYMAVDAKMSDIMRQLRNPNGSTIDVLMLGRVLQFFAEGKSMNEFLASFPNEVAMASTSLTTLSDAQQVFGDVQYYTLTTLGLPGRILERLSRATPIGVLRNVSGLTEGVSREEVQQLYGFTDRDMQIIDQRLAARGLRMKTDGEIDALLH